MAACLSGCRSYINGEIELDQALRQTQSVIPRPVLVAVAHASIDNTVTAADCTLTLSPQRIITSLAVVKL